MKTVTSRLCHEISISEKTGGFSSLTIFSESEKKLLTESLPSGQFIVFASDCYGPHLVTGEQTHWFSESDEYYQEFILDAFSLLCTRGLIKHVGFQQFTLSPEGVKVAYDLLNNAPLQGTCKIDAA